MKRFCAILAFSLCVSAVTSAEQLKEADLKAYLAGVSERGKDLYAYDQAAWHGTDAFFALKPDTRGLTRYICVKTPSGWRVFFPRWNETHDQLMVVYEAKEVGGRFTAIKFDSPALAKEDLIAKERALELATKDFGDPKRPYNSAILPAPDGHIYVYFYPGQTKENVWPLGGDVRYTISADGTKIITRRQLHKSVLDTEFKPGGGQVSGYHSHVLSDVPEDTDVLYVLNRKPSIPEYVGASKKIFVVNPDGSVEPTTLCGKPGSIPCEMVAQPQGPGK